MKTFKQYLAEDRRTKHGKMYVDKLRQNVGRTGKAVDRAIIALGAGTKASVSSELLVKQFIKLKDVIRKLSAQLEVLAEKIHNDIVMKYFEESDEVLTRELKITESLLLVVDPKEEDKVLGKVNVDNFIKDLLKVMPKATDLVMFLLEKNTVTHIEKAKKSDIHITYNDKEIKEDFTSSIKNFFNKFFNFIEKKLFKLDSDLEQIFRKYHIEKDKLKLSQDSMRLSKLIQNKVKA